MESIQSAFGDYASLRWARYSAGFVAVRTVWDDAAEDGSVITNIPTLSVVAADSVLAAVYLTLINQFRSVPNSYLQDNSTLIVGPMLISALRPIATWACNLDEPVREVTAWYWTAPRPLVTVSCKL